MMRPLALIAAVLLAGAAPAVAQSHTRPHDGNHPKHGPGHVRPDSATHAELHRLLHGSWTGTFHSMGGDSSRLDLSVARDSRSGVTLTVASDHPIGRGSIRDVGMTDNKLVWTHETAAGTCKATAALVAAVTSAQSEPAAPETLKGTMACEREEITFTLFRKTD